MSRGIYNKNRDNLFEASCRRLSSMSLLTAVNGMNNVQSDQDKTQNPQRKGGQSTGQDQSSICSIVINGPSENGSPFETLV